MSKNKHVRHIQHYVATCSIGDWFVLYQVMIMRIIMMFIVIIMMIMMIIMMMMMVTWLSLTR